MMNTYYVSPKGNDAWSGLLAEPNGVGTDGPWATVAHARLVIRERIAGGMTEPLTVLLRGGDYYLSEPLTFEEHDSGRDGFTVNYRNYPGETPVINGGAALTGSRLEVHHALCRGTSLSAGAPSKPGVSKGRGDGNG